MNPIIALAHAVSNNPVLTSKAEWQRLAKAAIKEYDRVCWENAELKKKLNSIGPKFQGMNELA